MIILPSKHTLILGIAMLAVTVLGVFSQVQTARGQRPINLTQLSGEIDPQAKTGSYYGHTVQTEQNLIAQANTPTPANSAKRIEVDLTNQRVYAFEGDTKVYDFLISSGKWGRTPTGTFRIWGKFRATKMEGGSKALRTYYYLPNVPYVMFFSNAEIPAARGFSLHGTYWHSNFGTPMSHGCINMKTEEAGLLYDWSGPSAGDAKTARSTAENPGTEVIIYGVAPKH